MNLRFSRFLLPAGALAAALLVNACSDTPSPASGPPPFSTERPTIRTVNYPLAYFAERLVGDHADVIFDAPGDGDPAYWKPDDDTLAAFQSADLVVLNGASYAKWLKTASLPESRTLDTSAGFKDQYIVVEDSHSHSHGDGVTHTHHGVAFTTWLDFTLAGQQAAALAETLADKMPAHAEAIHAAAEKLAADLASLDADMQAVAERIGDRPLFVSHPVYQYWSRQYDLNTESVHWEPDVAPDSKALGELEKKAVSHDAKWMVWEGEPVAEAVDALAQRGLQSVVFDPCGNRPDGETDWLAVMRANLKNLEAVAAP